MIYSGEWLGNVRWGQGVQVWPDGAKYEGNWENGKANGFGISWIIKENLLTSTEIFMREIGKMTRLRVKVYIVIIMEQNMKVSGLMITSTGSELKRGLTVVNMKAVTFRGRRMARVNILGKMAVFIREIGKTTKSMDLAFTFGLMAGNMKENG